MFWATMAAAADPYLVKPISPQVTDLSTMVAHNGKIYFAYNDGVHGSELWCSDGTDAGTCMVKDICAGTTSSTPTALTSFGGKLFFVASDGIHGKELWWSDGTTAGTNLYYEFYPGPSNGMQFEDYSAIAVAGHYLYFGARRPEDMWGGSMFAISDSALNSPLQVTFPGQVLMYLGSYRAWCDWNGSLFCFIDDYTGTYNPTNPCLLNGPVKTPLDDSQYFAGYYMPTVVGNKCYFASEMVYPALYVSDGTSAGPVFLHYFNNKTVPISQMFAVNNKAILRVGDEVWTSAGTEMTTTRMPNPYMGGVNLLLPFGNQLFMGATHYIAGNELWVTDGSYAGTKVFMDINPTGGSYPNSPIIFNNRLYFSASDGTHGQELWSTDGTTASTTMVYDIRAGNADSSPTTPVVCGRTLFFTAIDDAHGRALWALPLDARSGESFDIAAGDTAPVVSTAAQMMFDFSANSAPGRLSLARFDAAAPNRTGEPAGYWQLTGLQDSTFSVALTFNYDPIGIAAAGLSAATIGLIKSTDGGATWSEIPSVVDPSAHTIRTGSAQTSLGLYAIAATATPMSVVWVDFDWSGLEAGTTSQPYNTIFDGIERVVTGGTVRLYPGATLEHPRITKQLRIESSGGTARVGAN